MKTKIFLEKSHPKPNYLLDTKLMFKNVLSRKFLYKSFGRKTLNINFKNSTKVTIIYFCQKTKKNFHGLRDNAFLNESLPQDTGRRSIAHKTFRKPPGSF